MKSAVHHVSRHYHHFIKWQERTREVGLTALLFIEGALLFVVTPLTGMGWLPGFVLPAMFTLFALSTLVVTSRSHFAAAIVFIASILSSAGILINIEYPSIFTEWLSAGGRMLGIATLSVVIARAVFGPGRVTWHRVQGAVVLYMNFALFLFIAYQLIDHLVADAFAGLPTAGSEYGSGAALMYFSFGSLTSANFGDIRPVYPIVRNLTNLESVIGQLFPATLLARLVSLEISERYREKKGD